MRPLENTLRIDWKYLVYAALIAIDILLFFLICFPAAEMNQYFIRDILRAKELLNGHFISVGPDFTSGNYAPGPFFYFLLSPIVRFTQKADYILIYLFTFKLVIQFYFSRYLEKLFSIPFFYFYLFLSASPIIMRSFYWPNNAALIVPLTQLLCLFAAKYHFALPQYKLRMLLLMSTLLGLSFQVHFSLILALPIFLFLIGDKNSETRGRLKDTGIFFLCLFATLSPFVFSVLNSGSLRLYDGPVFYTNDLGVSFFFKTWGLQVGRTFSNIPELDLFNLFYWFIFIYTVVKGTWIILSKRPHERTFYERLFVRIFTLTLLMSPWILSGRVIRYYSMLYFISYLFFVIELYISISKRTKFVAVPVAIASIGFVLSWTSLYDFYRNLGLVARCESCILQIDKICDYMNDKGISYSDFRNLTYEILENDNEGSAALAKECFVSQEGKSLGEKKRYLLVHSSYLEGELLNLSLENLPLEIRSIYRRDRLQVEIKTEGFYLYSVPFDEGELKKFQRLSNLAFVYEVDPAMGEAYTLARLRQPNAQLLRASFCTASVFCDLYVTMGFDDGVLSLLLQSRIFQTKYDLAPASARAEGIKLNYFCDGKVNALDLVSTIGAADGGDQNSTFFTPLKASYPLPCKNIQLKSLSVDKIRIFYSMTGQDLLVNQEYSLNEIP